MSVYQRAGSKLWYATVDVDAESSAVFASMQGDKRRTKIGVYNTRAGADRQVARLATGEGWRCSLFIVPFTKTDRAHTKRLNERMKAVFRAQKAQQAVDKLAAGGRVRERPEPPGVHR